MLWLTASLSGFAQNVRVVNGMVVGEDVYRTLPSSEGYKEIRTITRIKKLYDVSAVSIPANDATSISARSLGEKTLAEFKKRMAEKRQLEIEKLKLKLRINM
jgi:phage head maturation protease